MAYGSTAQAPISETNTKLHPSITKADERQLKRIARLRNTAKRMIPYPKINKAPTADPQHTKQTQTQATEVLHLQDSPKLEASFGIGREALVCGTRSARGRC